MGLPAQCPEPLAKNLQANADTLCKTLPQSDPGATVLIQPGPEVVIGNGTSFGQAFKYAHATLGDNQVFTWNGGTYHTNLYQPGVSPAKAVGKILSAHSYSDLAKLSAKAWDSVDLGKIPASQLANLKPVKLTLSQEVTGNLLTEALITEGWFGNLLAKTQAALANVGNNITNKITADKLHKAWIKANKPVDTKQMRDFLVAHLSKVYGAEYNDTVVRIIDGLMKNTTSAAPEEVPGSTEAATPGAGKPEAANDAATPGAGVTPEAANDDAAANDAATPGAGKPEAANDATGAGATPEADKPEAANDAATPAAGKPKVSPAEAAASGGTGKEEVTGMNYLNDIRAMPILQAQRLVSLLDFIDTGDFAKIGTWIRKPANLVVLKPFFKNALNLSRNAKKLLAKKAAEAAQTTDDTSFADMANAKESLDDQHLIDKVLFECKTYQVAGLPLSKSRLFGYLKESVDQRLMEG